MPVMFWMVCLTFSCTFSHRGMTLLPYTTVRCTVTVAMPCYIGNTVNLQRGQTRNFCDNLGRDL